jgi:hypothetical protein
MDGTYKRGRESINPHVLVCGLDYNKPSTLPSTYTAPITESLILACIVVPCQCAMRGFQPLNPKTEAFLF